MTWSPKDGSLDFASLRAAYAAGALTPHDTINAIYDRIAARGDDHVWIYLVPREDALARCDALALIPRDAPLWGIPCGVKDNIDVGGLPSTSGVPGLRRVVSTTGLAVDRIVEAGAVVIGKTNLDQLGVGIVGVRSPYGVARNNFDPDFIPGGSSSGSGVAVGAGLVSFALGNDAAGSGRVPAGFNNIVGLKPTPGLVSNTSVSGGGIARTLETISVFALTVSDAMDVLRLMAGYDREDLFSKREADRCDLAMRPLDAPFRFGIPRSDQLEFCGDAEAADIFQNAVSRLIILGGTAVEIDFTPYFSAQRMLYEGPFLAERKAVIDQLVVAHENDLHPITREILSTAKSWTAVDAYRAIHHLAELKRESRRHFVDVDVLVVPTTPTIFRIAEIEAEPVLLNAKLGTYTNFVNLMELCGVAIPAGFRSDGLPLGITILAEAFQEGKAASIAAAAHRAAALPLGATRHLIPA